MTVKSIFVLVIMLVSENNPNTEHLMYSPTQYFETFDGCAISSNFYLNHALEMWQAKGYNMEEPVNGFSGCIEFPSIPKAERSQGGLGGDYELNWEDN